jgi:hypothetical protein
MVQVEERLEHLPVQFQVDMAPVELERKAAEAQAHSRG